MKNLLKKIKSLISTPDFKAGIWIIAVSGMVLTPILAIFITLLKQYSIITSMFWIAIYVFLLLIVLLLCFASVIYEVLLNNYKNINPEKGHYWHIFKRELLGPFGLSILLSGTIIFLDQLTKIIAINNLTNKGSVDFIKGIINFRLAYNKGAAWSMCSDHTDYLAFLSLIASVIIIYFLKDFNLKNRKIYSFALTFILGGTIGNMIDRFFRVEGVVDFIEVGFMEFPIFNIADSFLVIGTIMLMFDLIILDYFRSKKEKSIQNLESTEENTND